MALSYSTKDSFLTRYGNAISLNQPNNMTMIPTTELPNNMSVGSPITSVNVMPRIAQTMTQQTYEYTPISAGNENLVNGLREANAPIDNTLKALESLQTQQNEYLQKAQAQQNRANQLKMVSAGLQTLDAYNTYKSVKATKVQYDTQKKLLDMNLANTESALESQLRENMSDLDTIAAAKNVDLSSQAITGAKEKAMEDLGKDISQMRRQNDLQKSALDLQYKLNKYQARSNLVSSAVNTGLTIASLI